MNLQTLKISGFKSFVDPTNVPLPGRLNCIVGPNGCGKSNIIDAVRWVLGESSAKDLRGESMVDVIFNGSSARKPVGQASVELVFENHGGIFGGEYAQYAEISIKRVVTRDAISQYYLNGQRCRRKDILRILLGTGLGINSYAIIEQGMVNRLIEAKPEELRINLEEAAGISKYKERRRETENRIRHTQENLDRLNDIREELSKQLERLNRQARAAERYQEYRAEERLFKAQLINLRWQVLNTELQVQNKLIKEQEIQLESFIADQHHATKNIEEQRAIHTDLSDNFQIIQKSYYKIETEIARLQEAIQHQRERREQLQKDLRQAEQELLSANQHLAQDEKELTQLHQDVAQLEPAAEEALQQAEEAQSALTENQSQRDEWQVEWDSFTQLAAESSQQAQVEQTRIQHLEQRLQSLKSRITRLQEEQLQYSTQEVQEELDSFAEQYSTVEIEYEAQKQVLNRTLEDLQQLRLQNENLQLQLDEAKHHSQDLRGRHTSLEVLQQAALGQEDSAVMQWLNQQELTNNPRLAEVLTVESGWENAVEAVLGHYLQAVGVSEMDSLIENLEQFKEGHLSLLLTAPFASTSYSQTKAVSLASKVKSAWSSVNDLLNPVYLVETLSEALELVKQLAEHEMVVTREGICLGRGWIRVAREINPQVGILQRQQELQDLSALIENQLSHVNELTNQLEDNRHRLLDLEEQRTAQQECLTVLANQRASHKAQVQVNQNRLQQVERRLSELQVEIQELLQQQTQCEIELHQSREDWQEAMTKIDTYADTRTALQERREFILQTLQMAQEKAKQYRDIAREAEIKWQATKAQLASRQQNLERTREQIQRAKSRFEGIELVLNELDAQHDFNQDLQEKLAQHAEIDTQMKAARQQVEEIELILEDLERQHTQADQNARTVQNRLEKLRVDSQTLLVRGTTLEEQLHELEHTLESISQTMPAEATVEQWEIELQKIERSIQRLGPINLAAIEEFKTESERKNYLDTQHDDLAQALATLQDAIHKIDRETRQRFKETYDKVNEGFKDLFPRLFGGGSAYLELTGEDLLDTGVMVIAKPPGKRNTHIHMLSGGEKALTAVALVFSIFQLTPSPFCMLDEVDAPLDDANVVRFCNLLKEMAEKVQFIFITHNKLTMEIATHLSGVTMNEPGVSRIVSVNVDEAATMAMAEA